MFKWKRQVKRIIDYVQWITSHFEFIAKQIRNNISVFRKIMSLIFQFYFVIESFVKNKFKLFEPSDTAGKIPSGYTGED